MVQGVRAGRADAPEPILEDDRDRLVEREANVTATDALEGLAQQGVIYGLPDLGRVSPEQRLDLSRDEPFEGGRPGDPDGEPSSPCAAPVRRQEPLASSSMTSSVLPTVVSGHRPDRGEESWKKRPELTNALRRSRQTIGGGAIQDSCATMASNARRTGRRGGVSGGSMAHPATRVGREDQNNQAQPWHRGHQPPSGGQVPEDPGVCDGSRGAVVDLPRRSIGQQPAAAVAARKDPSKDRRRRRLMCHDATAGAFVVWSSQQPSSRGAPSNNTGRRPRRQSAARWRPSVAHEPGDRCRRCPGCAQRVRARVSFFQDSSPVGRCPDTTWARRSRSSSSTPTGPARSSARTDGRRARAGSRSRRCSGLTATRDRGAP